MRAYFRMPPDPAHPADEDTLRWLEEQDAPRRPPRRWTQAEFWARLIIACAETARPVTAAGIAREFVTLDGTRGIRTRYLKQLARRFDLPPFFRRTEPETPDDPGDADRTAPAADAVTP
jgi:hypothetical protein